MAHTTDSLKNDGECMGWPLIKLGDSHRRPSERKTPIQLMLTKTPDQIFEQLQSFKNAPEIAIDGMSGVGKSTLLNKMHRRCVKINEHCPETTQGSSYNISPIRTIDYLLFSTESYGHNIVWDRCSFSNLIFYIVHELMSVYKNNMIPDDFNLVLPHIIHFIQITGLEYVFKFILARKRVPTLFLVNCDLKLVQETLCRRNEQNDQYNATQFNYQMAQMHAYTFIALWKNDPIIDVAYWHHTYNLSIDDIQELIVRAIDDNCNNEIYFHPVSRENTKYLIELDDTIRKYMLFTYSIK